MSNDEFVIEDVEQTKYKDIRYVHIKLSNRYVRRLKSAVEKYEGDPDFPKDQEIIEGLREGFHEAWKLLNPS